MTTARKEGEKLGESEKRGDSEDKALVRVSFRVSNTGKRAGAEIAELYVGQQNPTVPRPIKELKGFKRVFLQPEESKRITLELDQRSFAFAGSPAATSTTTACAWLRLLASRHAFNF